jgi:hypothetical protein
MGKKHYETALFWTWIFFAGSLGCLLLVGYIFPNPPEALQNFLFFLAVCAFFDGIYEAVKFIFRKKKK